METKSFSWTDPEMPVVTAEDPNPVFKFDGIEVFLYRGDVLIDYQNVAIGGQWYTTPHLGVGSYAVDIFSIWEEGNGHKHCLNHLHQDFNIGGTNHTPTPTDSTIPPPTDLIMH